MKTLLLVDDDNLILSSLSEALRLYDANLVVLTAENGEVAEKILDSAHIDLLLTDLNMPVKSGFELLTYTMETHPDMPVIAMTALLTDKIDTALKKLNVSNCIAKPFKFEQLTEMIYSLLCNGSRYKKIIGINSRNKNENNYLERGDEVR